MLNNSNFVKNVVVNDIKHSVLLCRLNGAYTFIEYATFSPKKCQWGRETCPLYIILLTVCSVFWRHNSVVEGHPMTMMMRVAHKYLQPQPQCVRDSPPGFCLRV